MTGGQLVLYPGTSINNKPFPGCMTVGRILLAGRQLMHGAPCISAGLHMDLWLLEHTSSPSVWRHADYCVAEPPPGKALPGAPALLLVHGFGAFGDQWRGVLQPLADAGYRWAWVLPRDPHLLRLVPPTLYHATGPSCDLEPCAQAVDLHQSCALTGWCFGCCPRRVYAPTFPGFGRSEKAAVPYSQVLWSDFLR